MIQKSKSRSQRLKRVLAIVLALLAVYVCFGIWGVPAILKSQIQKRGSELVGRDLSLEKVTFNPFSLEAEFYGLRVGPAEGKAQDLLRVAHLTANPQLSSAFGPVRLKSARLEEADLWVSIEDSGHLSFEDILETLGSAPAEPTSEVSEPLQAIVEELSVSEFSIHFKDTSLSGIYEETLTINEFLARDIGTVAKEDEESMFREGGAAYHWTFDGNLSTASGATTALNGGATSIDPWGIRVEMDLGDFAIGSLQPYLSELAVIEVVGNLSARVVAVGSFEADAEPELTVTADTRVEGFKAKDDTMEYLSFDELRIENVDANALNRDVSISGITLRNPVVNGLLQADGTLKLPVLKGDASGGGESSEDAETSPAGTFTALLDSLKVEGGRANFEDRARSTPFATVISDVTIDGRALRVAQSEEDLSASGSVEVKLSALNGDARLQFDLEDIDGLLAATVEVADFELQQLQPYVSDFANVNLVKGRFNGSLQAEAHGLANPQVNGTLALQDVEVREQKNDRPVFAVRSVVLDRIQANSERVDIALFQIESPLLTVWRSDEGANLAQLAKTEKAVEEKAMEIEEETGILVNIDRFELLAAGVDFVDTSLVSTHRSLIRDFDVKVDGISTEPTRIADYEFGGKIDQTSELRGKGKVSVGDPKRYLDVDLSFTGYDLTATSPYWETYLGRSLGDGQFTIHSKYEVRDNFLTGTNDFRIDQLTLGEKVESERAINLPIGFAIQLMKNPSGLISYDGLMVEGDLSEPKVNPWGLIGMAVRNLILNAATSPFKFLAGMVGGREDVNKIGFDIGQVTLDAEATEKADAVRKILSQRPGVSLEVAYRPDPKERDRLADRYAKHRIANPDFQVDSGLDLLEPVDEEQLKARVEALYWESVSVPTESAEAPAVETKEPETAPDSMEDSDTDTKERKPLFGRIARFFGFGKGKQTEASEPESMEVADAADKEGEDSSSGPAERDLDEGPSFEEKMERVLSEREKPNIQEAWIDDLANERIRNFKSQLLEDDAIDPSRVRSVPIDSIEDATAEGTLHLKLSA